MVAPESLGAEFEKVPESAASRLNGRLEEVREAKGGSMREKGAEIRRLLFAPEALRLGERPAGAVIGARGEHMLTLAGVLNRDGIVGGGGMDLDGVRLNVKGLNGFSETSFLLFFEGELNIAGSMFSLSTSSKVEVSNDLLIGEERVFDVEILVLPSSVEFCAFRPTCTAVSIPLRRRVIIRYLAYHSDDSLYSQDAGGADYLELQMALSPLVVRELPCCTAMALNAFRSTLDSSHRPLKPC